MCIYINIYIYIYIYVYRFAPRGGLSMPPIYLPGGTSASTSATCAASLPTTANSGAQPFCKLSSNEPRNT